MTRLIRLDDFPHGDKCNFLEGEGAGTIRVKFKSAVYRLIVERALNAFEQYNVPYILGATPLLLLEGDNGRTENLKINIEFLNRVVKKGKVVMHGFHHGWNCPDWANIASCWEHGGEFANSSKEQIQEFYTGGLTLLKKVNNFCEEDFIPPFNCYNQNLLDVLKDTNVKRIHGCDKEWDSYGYDKLNHYNIEPIISKYGVTYADANVVVSNLSDPSQITLHWCYDAQRKGWEEDYHTLCKELIK